MGITSGCIHERTGGVLVINNVMENKESEHDVNDTEWICDGK